MFDYLGILHDGSVAMTAALDTPAISTTRDAATGQAVIDLGTEGTPADGLCAVMVLMSAANGDTDTLDAFIESSDSVDMTGTTTGITKHGYFGVANATSGRIVGSEVSAAATTPVCAYVWFKTPKRYVRLNATVGTSPDSFGTVKVYLTPFPFPRL